MKITDVTRGAWLCMKDGSHRRVLHVGRPTVRPGGRQVPVFFDGDRDPIWVPEAKEVDVWEGSDDE